MRCDAVIPATRTRNATRAPSRRAAAKSLSSCLRATVLAAALLLAGGCSYPNQFRNVKRDAPHAVLVGKHVHAFHINQQPTSFWRCAESFRIPPGLTTVNVFTGHWDFQHYPLARFEALAGHRYTLQHQTTNGIHRVLLRDQPPHSRAESVITHLEAAPPRTSESQPPAP